MAQSALIKWQIAFKMKSICIYWALLRGIFVCILYLDIPYSGCAQNRSHNNVYIYIYIYTLLYI